MDGNNSRHIAALSLKAGYATAKVSICCSSSSDVEA